MSPSTYPDPIKVRSAFLSDVHLGTRECLADRVLDFLHSVEMENLYLVGDFIDLWSLRSGLYWPQAHNNILRTILGKAKLGTRVIYIPGNHDMLLRQFCGHTFGNVEIHREFLHVTARGLRMLVLHGDEFDGAVKCSRWTSALGTHMYDFTLRIGYRLNTVRRALGFPHWSLATWLKSRVGNAVRYVQGFERAAVHEARRRDLDGVICGHIHRPELTTMDGVLYCNDGDWVEHCTALVEDASGKLALWDWAEPRRAAQYQNAPSPLRAAA